MVRRLQAAQQQTAVLSVSQARGNHYVQRMLAQPVSRRVPAHAAAPAVVQRFIEFGPVMEALTTGAEAVAETVESAAAIELGGSVGHGGKNKQPDVAAIQGRLRLLGFLDADAGAGQAPANGAVSGGSLAATIAAIKRYQSEVLGFSRPDGRVDPGGKTVKALSAWQAAASPKKRPGAAPTPGAGPSTPRVEPVTPGVEPSVPLPTVPTSEIEATIASLKNPAVDSIVADLNRMATAEQAIAKDSKEETGAKREKLVEDIAAVRAKIQGLSARDLGIDAPTLAAIQAHFFKTAVRLTPYYAQGVNVDILSRSGTKAAGRTCNVTSISMTLEGLGKSTGDFAGSVRLIGNIAAHYEGVLGAGDVTGLRLPDFLQLVAIYASLVGGKSDAEDFNTQAETDPPAFVKSVEKARDAAANLIVQNYKFEQITQLFGVKATVKMNPHHDALSAFGEVTRGLEKAVRNKKNKGKSREEVATGVREYYAAPREATIQKLEADIETLKSKAADASGKALTKLNKAIGNKEKALARERGLLAATLATESPAEMEKVLSIANYKASVLGPMNELLGSGKQVVVNLHNHFVRLESVGEDGVVVDDPGSSSKKNLKLSWADARALGYFKRYTIME